ncbi:MAG: N-acetylmuramoyl-L-alanine amidase [Lachnospiraceae bacterium]|nr:N-acetylmuramoyl-L-alanine amidase [Lachnospiraceae bacterium]
MKRRKKARITINQRNRILICIAVVVVVLVGIVAIVRGIHKRNLSAFEQVEQEGFVYTDQPDMDIDLLTPNEYSRPQIALDKVKGVVVHYTANPGSSAKQNRDYFEGLKDSHITKASAHFVIGIDGEIVQCIPTAEIAYASNSRNQDTVAIECCHPDKTGKFTDATYQSLIRLTAFLLGKFDLTTDDVIRHYDITGKNCPKYFVENESAWIDFKEDVNQFILENGET